MTVERCPRDEQLWPLIVDEPAESTLRSHLDRCVRCRRRVDRRRRELGSIRSLARSAVVSSTVATRLPMPVANSAGDATLRASGDGVGEPVVASSPLRLYSAPAGEEPLPTRIGRYPVCELIGRGGQGTVYRGLHPSLAVDVVIKLGHHPLGTDEGVLPDLAEEARLLARLDHPHLARVFDCDVHAGYPFVVTEHIPGQDLRCWSHQRSLRESEIVQLLAKLARAVATLHRQGILHCDLKPENIVITDDGEPVLIDFGLACRIPAAATAALPPPAVADRPCGTWGYMAPERCLPSPLGCTVETDIFGLGAVLYYLLVGHPPVRRRWPASAAATMSDALATVTSYPGIDERSLQNANGSELLKCVCRRALALLPEQRQASADEFAAALERAVARRWLPARRFRIAVLLCSLMSVGSAKMSPCASPAFRVATGSAPLTDLRVTFTPGRPDDPRHIGGYLAFCGNVPQDCHSAMFISLAGRVYACGHRTRSGTEGRDLIQFPASGGRVPIRSGAQPVVIILCMRRHGSSIAGEDVAADLSGLSRATLPSGSVLRFSHRGTNWLRRPADDSTVAGQIAAFTPIMTTVCERLAARFDEFHGIVLPAVGADPHEDTGSEQRAEPRHSHQPLSG